MELDIKKIVEEQFGFEVDNIEVEPIFDGNKFIGMDIFVQPKKSIGYIINKITITKKDGIIWD